MIYRLKDRFGSLPIREYDRLCSALCTARMRARTWNRMIIVYSDGKYEWIVLPSKQVTKKVQASWKPE